MNELDQSKVMNENDESPEMRPASKGKNAQFPGNKMPQTNHMTKSKKKRVAVQSRHGEHR